MIKKTVFAASSLLIFLGLAPEVFAQGFVPLAQIPGLTTPEVTSVVNANSLAIFFNNLYKYAIGFAATLAVIEIIWGGLEISTKDSVSKNKDGKERIQNAIFGLVLVLSPALVFTIINPAILNLSLNLPPLQTTAGTATTRTPGTTRTQTSTTDASTGCSVVGAAGVLQIATCPSFEAAGTWSQSCPSTAHVSAGPYQSANGVVTSSVMLCTWEQYYVFVNTGDYLTLSSTINRLQPVTSVTERPSNGSDAVSFANTCRVANIGRQTCVSDNPTFTFSTPCPFSTSLSCYRERLTCESVLTASGKCSDSPNWSPRQQ